MQRKKPFSGKQKKEQMKLKRAAKSGVAEEERPQQQKQQKQQQQQQQGIRGAGAGRQGGGGGGRRNMRPTLFEDDSKDEILACRVAAGEPLDLELRTVGCRGRGRDGGVRPAISMPLDTAFVPIPKRPPWDASTSARELEALERREFEEWLAGLRAMPDAKEHLNWFECNLETWRQLWRVCERSDIILYVADSRNPLFHFSRAIYDYVVNDLKKPIILVLSKTDLSDPETLDQWEAYLRANLNLADIVRFSAFQGFHSPAERDRATSYKDTKEEESDDDDDDEEDDGDDEGFSAGALRKAAARRGKNRYSSPSGREMVLEAIRAAARKHYGEKLELLQARALEESGRKDHKGTGEEEGGSDDEGKETVADEEEEGPKFNVVGKKEKRKKKREERKQRRQETTIATRKDTIVVGAIGNPNQGKSALINGLALHKVVSVSRTPGHTKNFQTYNLAQDIILCDCPGMVFPALDRPKYMQVLCGLYPLANLREPFTPIRYVAEHIALEELYNLGKYADSKGTTESTEGIVWTPMLIAEALATKRGYFTGRAGRPDAHRAARDILFDVVDGVVPLYWAPPEPLELAQELQKRDAERYTRLIAGGMAIVEKEKEAAGSKFSSKSVPHKEETATKTSESGGSEEECTDDEEQAEC